MRQAAGDGFTAARGATRLICCEGGYLIFSESWLLLHNGCCDLVVPVLQQHPLKQVK